MGCGCWLESVSRGADLSVREGSLTVARHFSGGWIDERMRVPSARLKRTPGDAAGVSAVPPRRESFVLDPALKRRATISRPSGACSPDLASTHGLRRWLHSCAASRLNDILTRPEGPPFLVTHTPV